jgi:hypothetical protein
MIILQTFSKTGRQFGSNHQVSRQSVEVKCREAAIRELPLMADYGPSRPPHAGDVAVSAFDVDGRPSWRWFRAATLEQTLAGPVRRGGARAFGHVQAYHLIDAPQGAAG